MWKKTLAALALFVLTGCAASRRTSAPAPGVLSGAKTATPGDTLIARLLHANGGGFDTLVANAGRWNIQIIYTQIDRDADNRPVFTNHFFGQPAYFYPASTVKMPVALLALQRLRELGIPGLDRNSTCITTADAPGQTAVFNDPSTPDGRPTIAQYIRKIFLVSDNDAFNRLYEFLGQEYINGNLHKMGYDSAQVLHRLNIFLSEEGNRVANGVSFYDSSARLLYRKPPARSAMTYQPRHDLMGTGYYSGGKLVNAPFDFSRKNRLPLASLHALLESVIFPEAVPERQRFRLTDDDYRFVYRYMSMRPRDAGFPPYDSSYNGAYSKLLYYGGKGDIDSNIRIFNKEGDAYGFLTDAAYIIDDANGVEFLLSATISCNSDNIYNDDRYDYETVGLPFLRHLGRIIYQYELTRSKTRKPDLSRYK